MQMNVGLFQRSCFVKMLGALMVGFAIAACTAEPSPTESSSASANQTDQAKSASGSNEQIILAIGGESEEGYDPTLGWGRYGAPLFQSTLLKRDENLNIVNDLATDYSISEDGKTWTVTIREDALFLMASRLLPQMSPTRSTKLLKVAGSPM